MVWNFKNFAISKAFLPGLLGCLLTGLVSISTQSSGIAANPESTHKATTAIYPKLDGKKLPFNTFSMSPQRELWLCCSSESAQGGTVLVYSVLGEFVREVKLSFIPQSIGFSSDGKSVFVAGSGFVAKLQNDGSIVKSIEAPNIGNKEEALEAMRKEAEEQASQVLEGMKKQVEQVEKQIAKLEKAPEDETETQATRRERRLKILKQQAAQFEQMLSSVQAGQSVVGEESLSRLMRATGMAVSDQDIFVSLPTSKGYGYDVWRMNHDLEEPKVVIQRGSGCCGQYDIQSDGQNLLVAENGNFRVATYDRDGAEISHFGQRSTNKVEGFGSCCNPMNVRCCENGDVLTAESSIGHIKRFSSAGEFLGFVGTAPIGGGCKHVAIAHDEVSDRYFMFNQDRSCISVLVPRDQAQGETEDEKLAREAKEGLGKKLIGAWDLETEITTSPDGVMVDMDSIGEYYAATMRQVTFHEDGKIDRSSKSKSSKAASNGLSVTGLLATLSGSTQGDPVTDVSSGEASWQAISQSDQELTIFFCEGGVQSFGAKVSFDKDTASMKLFFGSPENTSGKPLVYRRKTSDSE